MKFFGILDSACTVKDIIHKIVDKFTKLSKLISSVGCYTADFLEFSAQLSIPSFQWIFLNFSNTPRSKVLWNSAITEATYTTIFS